MFGSTDHYILAKACQALTDLGYSVKQESQFATIRKNGEIVGDVAELNDSMTMSVIVVVRLGNKSFTLKTEADIEDLKKCLEPVQSDAAPDVDNAEQTITVQYRSEDTTRITVNEKGDWIDLYADETVNLSKGEHKLINLGVAMKLPAGYEGHLLPRSSTFKKWGIIQANHMGIVDNSYCGPNDWWMMSAIAMRDTVIERGDKICQFRIVKKQPKIKFVEGKMTDGDRGGFGSTGTK